MTAKGEPPRVRTYGDPKDIEVNLPAGMIVDPLATETRCTEAELESPEGPASCPNGAAVGVFSVDLDGIEVIDEPVYNMVAPAGVPSELGFDAAGIGLIMHVGGRLRTGGDYGLSAESSAYPTTPNLRPGADAVGRPLGCEPRRRTRSVRRGKSQTELQENGYPRKLPRGKDRQAVPDAAVVLHGRTADNDDEHGLVAGTGGLNPDGTPDLSDPRWQTASSSSPPLTGCENLHFNPKLTVSAAEPEAASAESPSGLSVDLKLPRKKV